LRNLDFSGKNRGYAQGDDLPFSRIPKNPDNMGWLTETDKGDYLRNPDFSGKSQGYAQGDDLPFSRIPKNPANMGPSNRDG
jgi:hypothetical protein